MVTAVCAVKNREHVLQFSIPTWLKQHDYINEIIVVDWSSDHHIQVQNKKVQVIRVDREQYFNLGKAYNLAVTHATNEIILKLDADYVFNPYANYFEQNKLVPGSFITGDHRIGPTHDHHGFIRNLNGFLHCYKSDFDAVGGYNENFVGYGYDDDDLYKRLRDYGLEHTRIQNNPCCVYHVPHDDTHRVQDDKHKNILFTSRKNFYISKPAGWKPHLLNRKTCVNLSSELEKYTPFKELNRGIERFRAIDSRTNRDVYKKHNLNLHPVSLQQQLYFSESSGAVGCFLSHYNIWKQIVNRKTPLTLVLEDDASPHDTNELVAHYDYLSRMYQLKKYDLVQFNTRLDKLNFSGDFNGTESYTLTYFGAKKLLASVNKRPWFNNHVYDVPHNSQRAQFDMFMNEPPQQWNQHKSCIVAAADVFIGLCSRLPDWCEHKLNTFHLPIVNLIDRVSTVTDTDVPFWEVMDQNELIKRTKHTNFKWWEHGKS